MTLLPALLAACSLAVAAAQPIESPQTPPPSPPPAHSTSPTSAKPAQPAPGPFPGDNLQFVLYLALLLGLFAGGAYLVRNGFTVFQPKAKGDRKLLISETRVLGNRQFLIVAEYESRKMLLGVCPGRIDYLCTLAEPDRDFPQISPEKIDV